MNRRHAAWNLTLAGSFWRALIREILRASFAGANRPTCLPQAGAEVAGEAEGEGAADGLRETDLQQPTQRVGLRKAVFATTQTLRQFSIFRPLTRLNSRSFEVTSTSPRASAHPAINAS